MVATAATIEHINMKSHMITVDLQPPKRGRPQSQQKYKSRFNDVKRISLEDQLVSNAQNMIKEDGD
ncbi:hypothetical protein L484_009265 [Morus notabilis]|uniref:Uncharacterized protein n=1 Tax=Morus notabilis TaxID=981085 RepID=W9S406_9ROSA|nr:hypothetical protein L484_009265 [Morus notabilis]